MRVVRCDPLSDPRWEPFLATHPNALVYHHPAWLRALAGEYGQEPIGLACEDGAGEMLGVLPLFRGRGLPFRVEGQSAGGRLSSLPRTPVAGPVAADRDVAAALLAAAAEHARSAGVRLQLKVEGRELDGLVDGLEGVPWLPAYAVELPDDPDALRFGNSRNHGRIMWAIGKARKHGVGVRPAESEADLRAWYGLYLETMRAHAVPPRSYRFFAALWHGLRPHGLMRLLLAERPGARGPRLIAGSVFLMYGRTVFYAYTGAHAEDLRLRANDVIQARAIRDAVEAGFRRYDLGEVSEDDPGLVEFKRKWGATPPLLYRYYYPALDVDGAGALESGSRLRTVAGRIWRRLPLRVTAVIGDRLYRYS
jgi:CelD/BcsL family acetyltransferase involved in cellulose biosynthesis